MYILSRILIRLMDLFNVRKFINKGFKNPRRKKNIFNEKYFKRKYNVDKKLINNKSILTIYKDHPSKNHIIFIHGGAFVNEGSILHRNFIERLINKYNYKISYLDYPLAPEATVLETQDYVLKAFLYIDRAYKNDKLILFGNSAGAGILVSLLMELRDLGYNTSRVKSILASPWLDASLDNEEIRNYVDRDFLLPLEGLKYTGLQYSGRLSNKDYLVSPIYGDKNNLGNLLIWVGSHDIFNPDTKLFASLSRDKKNTSVEFYEVEYGFHDFVFFPIKQAKEMIRIMNRFIN